MSFRTVISQFSKRQTLLLLRTSFDGVFLRSSSASSFLKNASSRFSQTTMSRLGMLRDRLRSSKKTQQVLKLQIEAFWQNHRQSILLTTALFSTYCLWFITIFQSHGILFLTVGLHCSKILRGMSNPWYEGFVVLLVLLGFVYARQRFGVDPEAVYRMALLQMNTHPGLLEVMGAPLTGSQTRVMGWRLSFQSRRVKMMFPVMGSHRDGTAFLDIKKVQGKYLTKVLGVDIRLPDDQEQRVFLRGDSLTFSKGGVLTSLKDPLLKAQQASALDAQEDQQDEIEEMKRRAQLKEERKLKRLDSLPKGLDEGGGMYLYERLYWRLRGIPSHLTSVFQRTTTERQAGSSS